MTLTVENGTGKPDAESLCSVAFADAYFSARNVSAWTGTEAEKEAYLRAATDYMEQVYRLRWAGCRVTSTQALSWPRANVPMRDAPGGFGSLPAYLAQDVVPMPVQKACAELALRSISGPLAPDVGRLKARVKVGPLETEYVQGASAVTTYRVADNLVAPYLGNSNPLVMALARA